MGLLFVHVFICTVVTCSLCHAIRYLCQSPSVSIHTVAVEHVPPRPQPFTVVCYHKMNYNLATTKLRTVLLLIDTLLVSASVWLGCIQQNKECIGQCAVQSHGPYMVKWCRSLSAIDSKVVWCYHGYNKCTIESVSDDHCIKQPLSKATSLSGPKWH